MQPNLARRAPEIFVLEHNVWRWYAIIASTDENRLRPLTTVSQHHDAASRGPFAPDAPWNAPGHNGYGQRRGRTHRRHHHQITIIIRIGINRVLVSLSLSPPSCPPWIPCQCPAADPPGVPPRIPPPVPRRGSPPSVPPRIPPWCPAADPLPVSRRGSPPPQIYFVEGQCSPKAAPLQVLRCGSTPGPPPRIPWKVSAADSTESAA